MADASSSSSSVSRPLSGLKTVLHVTTQIKVDNALIPAQKHLAHLAAYVVRCYGGSRHLQIMIHAQEKKSVVCAM